MTTTFAPPTARVAPFKPKRWLRNGHVMTVYAWARGRQFPNLPTPEARLIRVTHDTEVLAHCYWQPDRSSRATLVALHGLEGSSEAHYMRGLAQQARDRGWNAVLINQRNCGGTEHLTPRLYHSGLTADPHEVIRQLASSERLTRVGVVGYSLGGNLAVRLAGELGTRPDLPVVGVVAVSPTIDLSASVDGIEKRTNIGYHLNFVRNLRARMRRKDATWPGAFDVRKLDRVWTIRAFDEAYTAPHHGFKGATDYYHRASAMRVVGDIRIPALIVAAEDDPFVPVSQFRDPALHANPHIVVRIERYGGHCGFIGADAAGRDCYWAEDTAVAFLAPLMTSG